jgi:hypothetical protein
MSLYYWLYRRTLVYFSAVNEERFYCIIFVFSLRTVWEYQIGFKEGYNDRDISVFSFHIMHLWEEYHAATPRKLVKLQTAFEFEFE